MRRNIVPKIRSLIVRVKALTPPVPFREPIFYVISRKAYVGIYIYMLYKGSSGRLNENIPYGLASVPAFYVPDVDVEARVNAVLVCLMQTIGEAVLFLKRSKEGLLAPSLLENGKTLDFGRGYEA